MLNLNVIMHYAYIYYNIYSNLFYIPRILRATTVYWNFNNLLAGFKCKNTGKWNVWSVLSVSCFQIFQVWSTIFIANLIDRWKWINPNQGSPPLMPISRDRFFFCLSCLSKIIFCFERNKYAHLLRIWTFSKGSF